MPKPASPFPYSLMCCITSLLMFYMMNIKGDYESVPKQQSELYYTTVLNK